MYSELSEFVKASFRDKAYWKDGEFWTALGLGIAATIWCAADENATHILRDHFGDILTVTSIIFGFELTTLFFYVDAAATWANDKRVERVAERLVNWHVWTIFCLLALLAYTIFLSTLGQTSYLAMFLGNDSRFLKGLRCVGYGFLAFLASYSSFQIVNHVLTVRWAFRKRRDLQVGPPPKTPRDELDSTG